MSAKLLNSLTDENKDLHKQIGCMNGIFQLFDRRHFLTGGGNNTKRLPSGQKTVNHGMEPESAKPKPKEKNRKEIGKERERVSAESSRTSFSSSSCSSTFSSVDCNRMAQPEPSSSQNSIFSETPSEILTTKQPNRSRPLGQQSLDLRDVVKDSIQRETHGLSVKTTSKEEGRGQIAKHIDSPRPTQVTKSGKPKVPGLVQNTPWNSNGNDLPFSLATKDSPRFSFDGRESRETRKSNMKLKELPRLSLDSRAGSIRSADSPSRANSLLEDLKRGNGNTNKILNMDQEPGSNKRPSGVVAKLMGLEAFPDTTSPNEGIVSENKPCLDKDFDSMSTSSRIAEESKQNQVFRSPRMSRNDPASPRLENANSNTRSTSNSRFSPEPAPWKRLERSQISQNPAHVYREASTKDTNSSNSVYGEIEKRLKELEFNTSSKNLRALKQILEAMEKTRERLDGEKEEHASEFEARTSDYNTIDRSPKLTTHQCQQISYPISPTLKGTSSPKRSESPIVIIKPAKLLDKARNAGSFSTPIYGMSGLSRLRTSDSGESIKFPNDKRTAKDLTPRNINHIDPCRSTHVLKAPQPIKRENPIKPARSSRTMSPKLQQKKQVMDKQSCPTSLSSDLIRAKRQPSKQSSESSSPRRKLKPKSAILQQSDDQLSEISSEIRNSSCQSEIEINSTSQIETEVTSTCRFDEINRIYQQKDQINKNLAARLSADESLAELRIANKEKPSPVSVLDAMFDREGSPSPVKKISNAFKDDEAEWNSMDLDYLLNNTRPNLSSSFDQKELENSVQLVHNLRQLNSFHEEAKVERIASLCENTNQEHRYIAEIMLASGLLHTDQEHQSMTIQLDSSGHLINPNLFHALERAKRSLQHQNDEGINENITPSKPIEKIQRKLIFDTVNETLLRKLASSGSSEMWISPNKMSARNPSGQKLLKEICSEIDHLQPNKENSLDDEDDLMSIISETMNQSEYWADYHGEVPGLVLDIERMIFKDLIGEVLNGEEVSLKGRPSRHCRQLFSK